MTGVRDSRNGWTLGASLALVAVVVAAAWPGSSRTGSIDDELPRDSSLSTETALVATRRAEGGLKLAGLRVISPSYSLEVRYLGGDDCIPPSGTSGLGSCQGPDGLVGEAAGITPGGQVLAGAVVEVTGECFRLIEVGDEWPSFPECSAL